MIKITIGENAGKIWQTLEKNRQMSFNELKEQSTLSEQELLLAIGWLSRENKIYFFLKEKELYVCLIE